MSSIINAWTLPAILIILFISKTVYNLWLHPLKHYPGPRVAAASRLWYVSKVIGGHHKYAIQKLHDQYGFVVRIAPNELSYIDPSAWQDIYGKIAHQHGPSALEKDPDFFAAAFGDPGTLVDADSGSFKPQKNNATRAFSQGTLLSRGEEMTSLVDRSVKQLEQYLRGQDDKRIDINPWVGNMVLDIHSQLTISRNLAAIDLGPLMHPVVTNMHSAVTTIQYCMQLSYLPSALTSLPGWLLPGRDIFTVLGRVPPLGPAINDRLASDQQLPGRQDFVSHMLSDDNANVAIVRKNALIFILSGVETVPGYVCSVLYYLLEKPDYFTTAANEIRTTFASAEDISVAGAQKLLFLQSCMRETLRVSPPAVGTLPRRIPRDGAVVCGGFVPGNVAVGIHNWSVTHSGHFYKDADHFRPERWMDDVEFASDKGECFNPFGVGPRTCVARHLVLLEATLIVAKLLFSFDMSIDLSQCGDWPFHKGHFVPTRSSLFIAAKIREM